MSEKAKRPVFKSTVNTKAGRLASFQSVMEKAEIIRRKSVNSRNVSEETLRMRFTR